MSKIILLGNIVSQLVGKVSRFRIPIFGKGLNYLFVKIFGINMKEADRSLKSYESIEDIFTRALKPGSRPITNKLCIPADGIWSQAGEVQEGMAIQVKGLSYSVHDLIGSEDASEDLSYFATVYLAPHNYHRVHSPVSGSLIAATYIPGALWPVNEPFVNHLPKLFNRNERLVFEIDSELGGKIYVVMVGALNVGRIRTPFLPSLFTNDKTSPNHKKRYLIDTTPGIAAGDELGTFMLGSTAVVVFDAEAASNYSPLKPLYRKKPVRMGEALEP